jgi:hypothetical protein
MDDRVLMYALITYPLFGSSVFVALACVTYVAALFPCRIKVLEHTDIDKATGSTAGAEVRYTHALWSNSS